MESTASREHPTPEHTLRVLVRIDTQLRQACLEVRGCLTVATCPTLITILTHTGALGAAVSVNLLRAAHVEHNALELLRDGADPAVLAGAGAAAAGPSRYGFSQPDAGGDPNAPADALPAGRPVEILAPRDFPVCCLGPVSAAAAEDSGASGHPLSNEDAAELAFLQKDPRVLADRSGCRPRRV